MSDCFGHRACPRRRIPSQRPFSCTGPIAPATGWPLNWKIVGSLLSTLNFSVDGGNTLPDEGGVPASSDSAPLQCRFGCITHPDYRFVHHQGVGFPPSSCPLLQMIKSGGKTNNFRYCHAIPLTRHVPTGVHRRKSRLHPNIATANDRHPGKKSFCQTIQMQFKTAHLVSCARKIACRRPSTPRCVTFTLPAAFKGISSISSESIPVHVSAATPLSSESFSPGSFRLPVSHRGTFVEDQIALFLLLLVNCSGISRYYPYQVYLAP